MRSPRWWQRVDSGGVGDRSAVFLGFVLLLFSGRFFFGKGGGSANLESCGVLKRSALHQGPAGHPFPKPFADVGV